LIVCLIDCYYEVVCSSRNHGSQVARPGPGLFYSSETATLLYSIQYTV
jgi:hypothetical protein